MYIRWRQIPTDYKGLACQNIERKFGSENIHRNFEPIGKRFDGFETWVKQVIGFVVGTVGLGWELYVFW